MNTTLLWFLIAIHTVEIDENKKNTIVTISPAKLTDEYKLSYNNNSFQISQDKESSKVLLKKKDEYYNIYVNDVQMCFSKQSNTPIVCKSEDAQGAAWLINQDDNGLYEIKSKKNKFFWTEMCLYVGDKLEIKNCKDTEEFKFKIKEYKLNDDNKTEKEKVNGDHQENMETDSASNEDKDNEKPRLPIKPEKEAEKSNLRKNGDKIEDKSKQTENNDPGIQINCENDNCCNLTYDKDKKHKNEDSEDEAEYCKESNSESSSESDGIDDKLKDFFDNIMCDKIPSTDDIVGNKKLNIVCNKTKSTIPTQPKQNTGASANIVSQPSNNTHENVPIGNKLQLQQNDNIKYENGDINEIQKSNIVQTLRNEPNMLKANEHENNFDEDMCEDITDKINDDFNLDDKYYSDNDNILTAIMNNPNHTMTKKQLIKHFCNTAKKFNDECKENIKDKKGLLEKLCKVKGKIININTKPRLLSDFELTINPFENFPKEIVKTYDDLDKIIKNYEKIRSDDIKKEFKSTYKDLVNEIKEEKNQKDKDEVDLVVNVKDNAGNILSTQKKARLRKNCQKL